MINPTERRESWYKCGTDVRGCTDYRDVLRKANLDYKVELKPVHVADEHGTLRPVKDRFATVRNTDGHVYEIVSDRYQVLQNEDAFDFVGSFANLTDLKWKQAGETAGGLVWMIAGLPEQNILDDVFRPYIIFQNSFNTKGGVKTALTPLRMVCRNQFNFAFKHSSGVHNIKHVGWMEGKLIEAQNAFSHVISHMDALNETAERLAVTRLDGITAHKLMNELFPLKEDSKSGFARDHAERTRDAFTACLNADDNSNYRDTAWGWVNAYTDYTTHTITSNRASDSVDATFNKTALKDGSMNKVLKAIETVTGVGA